MIRKILISCVVLQFILLTNLWSQWGQYYPDDNQRDTESYNSFEYFKPINLIDIPTANILSEDRGVNKEARKYFHLTLRVYNLGGMIGGISVGLTKHLMFGVTYGGQNVIGEGDVIWNPSPGIHFRYKIFPETYPFPTLAIGFDSQGYGGYDTELERYIKKSYGGYLVASKNYANPFLNMGLHGGINYSAENKGSDKDMNIFLGAHIIMEDELSFLWEYDLGINDNDENSLGEGKGYMNAAIRWLFAKRLILEFSIKNMLKNRKPLNGEKTSHSNRELKIIYRQNL